MLKTVTNYLNNLLFYLSIIMMTLGFIFHLVV